MRIDELDDRMRAFEAALDPCVLPGVFLVVEWGSSRPGGEGGMRSLIWDGLVPDYPDGLRPDNV